MPSLSTSLCMVSGRPHTGTLLSLYLMNLLTVNSVLTVERCDNKLPHKVEPSKLPFEFRLTAVKFH